MHIEANSFLVVRLGAIGDALRVCPAIRRLRHERPDATVGTEEGPESARSCVLYLAGFAIALAFAVYVAYLAHKALDPFMTDHGQASEADPAS